ncbi:unnamed protein product [Polarella glacialis]|uniref:Uncharacterized protein n=1 Tax=Polarella glacialis TaxID=89957 RepID=A0A813HY32_POLGL|nr:unnamed protein product [Polarella glacialis]
MGSTDSLHSSGPDAQGVTPRDHAAQAEAVWPHFAAVGCERAAPGDGVPSAAAPPGRLRGSRGYGSGGTAPLFHGQGQAAAARPSSRSGTWRPVAVKPIDILAAEPSGCEVSQPPGSMTLRSLGL